MPGPIIVGKSPLLQAVLAVCTIAFLCILLAQYELAQRFEWFRWIVDWVRNLSSAR